MVRGYTTIEQSRKLAEILPLESADMYYLAKPDDTNSNMVASDICTPRRSENDGQAFGEACAWSLTALLNVIPCGQVNRMANSDKWEASSWNDSDFEPSYYVEDYDNPVDACVAMIERLHVLNLL